MKDEIKEILDALKNEYWRKFPEDGIPYKVLYMEERDLLLDYITKLQEDVRTGQEINSELQEVKDSLQNDYQEAVDTITNLQQENERLKEWKEDLLRENIELENIRKEAIEYIKGTTFFGLRSGKTFMSKYLNELLNILQNGEGNK